MGVVGTGAGETKPGLRGLNLDVLQALFRKGTHHSGQCTNHNLKWVVLDPKQLPFSYKILKHTPVGIFRLFFFFPLAREKEGYHMPYSHGEEGSCALSHWCSWQLWWEVTAGDFSGRWVAPRNKTLPGASSSLSSCVSSLTLVPERDHTACGAPLWMSRNWCAELSSLNLMLNG